MYLIFDTETTGLPKRWDAPISDVDNWPRVVQIAWQLHDAMGNLVAHRHELIRPEGFDIPFESEQIHGISTALAKEKGIPVKTVLEDFRDVLSKAKFIVGQNIGFDKNVVGAEFYRLGMTDALEGLPVLDTCTETTAELCRLPGGKGGKFKLPTLTELYNHLFDDGFEEAHNASADVEATARCFFELLRTGQGFTREESERIALIISPDYFVRFAGMHPQPVQPAGLKHINLKAESEKLRKVQSAETISEAEIHENRKQLGEAVFAHLHNHSQFSILQATSGIKELVKATARAKMPAVALTDTANMMGAFHFVKEINAHNKTAETRNKEALAKGELPEAVSIKPIIGCEFYVCENRKDRSRRDNGYRIVMLAKNKNGYRNLSKMASIAYIEGFYYVPRIDREIVARYSEDIIVLTGNLYGEVPAKILTLGERQAEEALLWWKGIFGDDLYIEIMRHGQADEDRVNETLLRFAGKHQVKVVATNNTFYINKEDANAHDILLCVKDGEKQSTPIGQGRGFRYGLPNQEYYFKSSEAMKELFKEFPEAIMNIREIIDKISYYDLAHDVLLPRFDIPEA
ncbi:MAG: PHP domain-containing protein, partial [Sinomicrobium sp.]|nr:PHP domain-containing protein [Sinomicrobium sp.]